VKMELAGESACAGFGDVLKGCMVTTVDCLDEDFRLTRTDIDGNEVIDTEPLTVSQPARISSLRVPLRDRVLKVTRQKAPNARIVLVGYPHVLDDEDVPLTNVKCNFGELGLLTETQAVWMGQMGDLMASTMQAAVTEAQSQTGAPAGTFRFADPRAAFAGHEACVVDAPEWINGAIVYSSTGSGLDKPGSGSFHPDQDGHAAYRSVVAPFTL
jgi:hypothetical protein